MLKFVGEYESVKKGEDAEFIFVKSLVEARGFFSQNFHEFIGDIRHIGTM